MEFRDHVTRQLAAMRDRSRMYGDPVTVEHLCLQMLELELLHYFPAQLEQYPRMISEAYWRELSERTGMSVIGLADPTRKPPIENLPQLLHEICEKIRKDTHGHLEAGNLPPRWPHSV